MSKLNDKAARVTGASRSAVTGMTGVLAGALGPRKIRLNAVNPGIVGTEGAPGAGFIGSEFEAGAAARSPLGRAGQPKDSASIVTLLASNDSYWLTGEHLYASGSMR